MPRMAIVIEFDGRHERGLVLRAAAGLTVVDTAEHCIVADHHVLQEPPGLALAHGFEQLVLDPPGRGVGDAEVALERQGRDVVVVLGYQVERLEPLGQRQPRGVEQGPGANRRLRPAMRALSVPALLNQESGVLSPSACCAHEALRSARLGQGRIAFGLGAVALGKLSQTHAMLKPNRVLEHCSRSSAAPTR